MSVQFFLFCYKHVPNFKNKNKFGISYKSYAQLLSFIK